MEDCLHLAYIRKLRSAQFNGLPRVTVTQGVNWAGARSAIPLSPTVSQGTKNHLTNLFICATAVLHGCHHLTS